MAYFFRTCSNVGNGMDAPRRWFRAPGYKLAYDQGGNGPWSHNGWSRCRIWGLHCTPCRILGRCDRKWSIPRISSTMARMRDARCCVDILCSLVEDQHNSQYRRDHIVGYVDWIACFWRIGMFAVLYRSTRDICGNDLFFFFLVGFVIELRLFFVNGSKADWNLLGTATLLLDKGNGFTIEPAQITIGHIGGHADTALHTEMGTGTAHVWLGKTVVTLNVSTAWCHIRHTENSESRAKWLTTRQSDARASSSSNWRKSSTTYYDEIHANYCARRCRCRQLAYLLAVHREVHHHLHHQQLGGNLAIRPFLEKEPRMRYKAPERYLEFFAINTSHFTKISLLIYYFTKKDESALHKGHAEAPLATNKSLVK